MSALAMRGAIVVAVLAAVLALYQCTGSSAKRDLSIPDPTLTPGAVRDLAEDEICNTRWGKDRRHVTATMRKHVMAEYHFSAAMCPSGRIELDHLVPREISGADDERNLWPMCYEDGHDDPSFGAHRKDRLENRVAKDYCAGALTLDEAQRIFTTDWRRAFVEYFGAPR